MPNDHTHIDTQRMIYTHIYVFICIHIHTCTHTYILKNSLSLETHADLLSEILVVILQSIGPWHLLKII